MISHYRQSLIAIIAIPVVAISLSSCSGVVDTSNPSVEVSPSTSQTGNDQFSFTTGSDEWVAWEALMGPDGEYAAAASYEAVLNRYGDVEPYATIYQAELRHIDALTRQLERMGVSVPENPYTGTIAAPDDLATAAEEWAKGEVLNVEMYDELLSYTDNPQLTKVLTNLRRASLENHLPAFEAAAANGGTSP